MVDWFRSASQHSLHLPRGFCSVQSFGLGGACVCGLAGRGGLVKMHSRERGVGSAGVGRRERGRRESHSRERGVGSAGVGSAGVGRAAVCGHWPFAERLASQPQTTRSLSVSESVKCLVCSYIGY